MDNKIEHFVLKEDGRIYWVEKMPDEPLRTNMGGNDYRDRAFNGAHEDAYKIELQSAIDNAVEVSNQKQVIGQIGNEYHDYGGGIPFNPEVGKVYSLRCSVETVYYGLYNEDERALVTFSQPERDPHRFKKMFDESSLFKSKKPEREETQEELEDGVQLTLSMNLGTFGRVIKALKTDPELWEEVKDELTRLSKEFETRKTP